MIALLALVPGAVMAAGLVVAVAAFWPQHAVLSDALSTLETTSRPTALEATSPGRGERWGTSWLRRHPVVMTPAAERALTLMGRSTARHYTIKLVAAVVGFLVPSVAAVILFAVGRPSAMPMVASVVAAVVGFVVPDVALRHQGKDVGTDAMEALLTYFDLVTLERLANQSATQALVSASDLSDNPVFVQIRLALERARLEQRMPYADLRRLGRELELPALVDLADVMALDESGASLAATLRARVKELRDAHLTTLKVAATSVSERMTVFMVIPSLIFGLILIAPPLMVLVAR